MNSSIENEAIKGSLVLFRTDQETEMRGRILRLAPHRVVFEIDNPNAILRTSEVLKEFQILLNEHTAYCGRAVVKNLINAGLTLVCEVDLEDPWIDRLSGTATNGHHRRDLAGQYNAFYQNWQKFRHVKPEFKAVMTDMQIFLTDLRLWLEQVELEIQRSPAPDRAPLERQVIEELSGKVIESIDVFIDRFETIAGGVEPDYQSVHRAFLHRQLHPLMMGSPFAHRTFHKPLGYAGDYGVVEMMMRSPHEGGTLFARIINTWLLGQAPAAAHRNRVAFLIKKLREESVRTNSRGRALRVFNIGCGPAAEVQAFLREHAGSSDVHFTLLDFNEETLVSVRARLKEIQRRHSPRTRLNFIKRSVHQMVKESGRALSSPPDAQYDLIYCAGLFDYLVDSVCQRLLNMFYEQLAPGGLLIATNVSDALNSVRPFRFSMEYILDWHLIYRGGPQLAALAPKQAPSEACTVISEDIGVNVFIEVRKPGNA